MENNEFDGSNIPWKNSVFIKYDIVQVYTSTMG
jgi:hypothetical protein